MLLVVLAGCDGVHGLAPGPAHKQEHDENAEAEHDGEHRSRKCLCQRAARRDACRDGV